MTVSLKVTGPAKSVSATERGEWVAPSSTTYPANLANNFDEIPYARISLAV